MPDSLKTLAQVLAALPDNTSQLISAQDVRESVIANLQDKGVVSDDADFTLTLTTDTWADIPSNSTSPTLDLGVLWDVDANDHLVPQWSTDYTVAAALERGADVIARVRCSKSGATQTYSFRVVRDGTQVGEAIALPIGATAVSISFQVADTYVVADDEDWSIEARPDGHGDDLDITGWSLAITGVLT